MQNRRDHLQAYRFATGRLSAALVGGDATGRDVPLRRARLGLGFGVLAAALVTVGMLVYGLISPGGNTQWRAAGSVVVEKETGSRFLYVDGVLRPTANFASAVLGAGALGGGTTPTVRTVTRDSLGTTPRGGEIGIVGAPESVPDPASLLAGWAVCVGPTPDTPAALDLAPDTRAAAGPGDTRTLVVDGRGVESVLWRGTLFRVPSRPVALALGLSRPPLPVPDPFLAAVPAGPALVPAALPGAGRVITAVDGAPAVVGQIFTTAAGDAAQYYVLTAAGLAPTTATEAALAASLPGAPAPRAVPPAALAALPAAGDDALLRRLPDLVGAPDAPADGRSMCARQAPGGAPAGLTVAALGAGPGRSRVLTEPGHGLFTVATPVTSRAPERWLVTDDGVRRRLVGDAAVTALGFGGVRPVAVPAAVLAAVPVGPALDPARALDPVRTVPVGTGS